MQRVEFKNAVSRVICAFEAQDELKEGDTVNRPYKSALYVDDYTRGSDGTAQDLTNANESLSVNQSKIILFYVDDLDELQSNYKFRNEYADDAGTKLKNWIDGDIFAESANANSTIDASDGFGGSASDGVSLTTANIVKLFTVAGRKLGLRNVQPGMKFAALPPHVHQILLEYLGGRETPQGDRISEEGFGENGYVGRFMNFDCYLSNATYWTSELILTVAVTDGDTFVLTYFDDNDGSTSLTLTFKTALTGSSTLHEVLIGANAAASRVNLVKAIMNTGTVDTHYSAWSSANRLKWKGLTAVDDASTKVTLSAKGFGLIVPTETFTSATNDFTAARQLQHPLFGRKGAVELVEQAKPQTRLTEAQLRLGSYVKAWTLYGKKTFREGKKWLCDAKVQSSTFAL